MPETNGSSRLDRIERALELLIDDHVQFREEHKLLLTAQVLLTDRVDKLAGAVDKLAAAQIALTGRVGQMAQHMDALTLKVEEVADKLNGLIGYVQGHGEDR